MRFSALGFKDVQPMIDGANSHFTASALVAPPLYRLQSVAPRRACPGCQTLVIFSPIAVPYV
jgi:hypothetical protein